MEIIWRVICWGAERETWGKRCRDQEVQIGGIAGGKGGIRWRGSKRKNWDKYNSIINNIN